MKKNSQGFATIEAALLVVILGILGFTGWYVWHAKQNAEESLSSNNSTTPIIKNKSTTNTSVTTPVSTAKYLEIKEDKIKFPISGVLTDAYYFPDPENSSDIRTITFSTHSLDSYNIAVCKAQAKPNAEVNVQGAAQLYFDGVKSEITDITKYKQAGSYWFSIQASKDCKSDDPTVQAKITAVQAAFEEATQSITAL